MLLSCLAVGLGGFFGALMRYLLCFLFNKEDGSIPIGTLFVNILACFLFGILSSFILLPKLKLFIITGFLGSLSTFSTYIIEHSKMKEHDRVKAYIYLFFSILIGIFMFFIGTWITPV